MIKKRLKNIIPYHAPFITEGIKLDANENAYGVPKELITHMQKWLEKGELFRYPDTDSMKLIKAIAKKYKAEENQVVCGVGSDQLIDCLIRAVVEEEDYVIAPSPSFSMYQQAIAMNAGVFYQVPLTKDFSYDIESLIAAIKKYNPKVVFLCNPNNPTGSILTNRQIEEIAAVTKGVLVVDEAYGEFANESAVKLINTYSNLIVFKTFSKAYALAGARVGYGIGSKEVVKLIYTTKPPYNLNSFSEEAATWTIEHTDLYKEVIETIKEQREKLKKELEALGSKVYPSEANFLWVEGLEEVFESLEKEHIFIRKMSYQNKTYYRISIGTEKENEMLLTAITQKIGQ